MVFTVLRYIVIFGSCNEVDVYLRDCEVGVTSDLKSHYAHGDSHPKSMKHCFILRPLVGVGLHDLEHILHGVAGG